jgi:hypothetical protein
MATSFAVQRESNLNTSVTSSNSLSFPFEGAASLRSAPRVARWKDAVESVSQLPITSIGNADGITYSEVQEPRQIAKATPLGSRLEGGSQTDEIRRISFEPLQEWEGCVAEIKAETFTATLTDITARRDFEDEIAEFPLGDVSDDDILLFKPGAIFRWLIGYERHPSGTKRRVSSVVFRRLPSWSTADLSRANQEAKVLVEAITWE